MSQHSSNPGTRFALPGMGWPPQLWVRRSVVMRSWCACVGPCRTYCWTINTRAAISVPATGTALAHPACGSRIVTRHTLRRFLVGLLCHFWLGRLYAINPPVGCINCHPGCGMGLWWRQRRRTKYAAGRGLHGAELYGGCSVRLRRREHRCRWFHLIADLGLRRSDLQYEYIH